MNRSITKEIRDQLNAFCNEAEELNSETFIYRWSKKVTSFLKTVFASEVVDEFLSLKHENLWDQLAMRLGYIKGLIAKASIFTSQNKKDFDKRDISTVNIGHKHISYETKKIFVVHGRNNEIKETVARFLEKIGLTPIILHEQPNSGRTIIEKFEVYSSDISFAVVLLTPDDVGRINKKNSKLQPRARQNVILELGYFMGRLGRSRVCALYNKEVELPSDYQGIVYIVLDKKGAWKIKLAQELKQSKLPIKFEGLVSG